MGKKSSLLPLGFLLLLGSCFDDGLHFTNVDSVTGYSPVYGPSSAVEIAFTAPKAVSRPGKIYRYGKYLLVNEKQRGIHVFDNTDPANPVNLAFLQLLGNTDMAIKDSVLYADYMGNVVALTVTDFATVEEKGLIALEHWSFGIPAPAGFYFECIDPKKGVVTGWIETELRNPKCYALQ